MLPMILFWKNYCHWTEVEEWIYQMSVLEKLLLIAVEKNHQGPG